MGALIGAAIFLMAMGACHLVRRMLKQPTLKEAEAAKRSSLIAMLESLKESSFVNAGLQMQDAARQFAVCFGSDPETESRDTWAAKPAAAKPVPQAAATLAEERAFDRARRLALQRAHVAKVQEDEALEAKKALDAVEVAADSSSAGAADFPRHAPGSLPARYEAQARKVAWLQAAGAVEKDIATEVAALFALKTQLRTAGIAVSPPVSRTLYVRNRALVTP
jgi:hypothetical protein